MSHVEMPRMVLFLDIRGLSEILTGAKLTGSKEKIEVGSLTEFIFTMSLPMAR